MGKLARLLGAGCLAAIIGQPAIAQPNTPSRRQEAVEVIRELRHIVTPAGVERNETVQIGGIRQYVSIRGADRRNPVLLIIHGGPGFPLMPLGWWDTHGLEEYFNVVQWDQRGAGKTYLINDPKTVAPTMAPERFVDDAEELTAWLRRQFGKDKIFVLGTSWGSYVGLELARRRPEWLHAYIGMGQLANSPESERRGYAFALAEARRTGNKQAIADLESIAPYAAPGRTTPLNAIQLERKWSDYFGGVMAYRHQQVDGVGVRLSPDYSDAEAQRIFDGNEFSERFLLSTVLEMDYSTLTKLDCPLVIFAGRHDRTVNSEVAKAWFDHVSAPAKRFVWFENSAHEIMVEEPGKFLLTLVDQVRPLATRDGELAP